MGQFTRLGFSRLYSNDLYVRVWGLLAEPGVTQQASTFLQTVAHSITECQEPPLNLPRFDKKTEGLGDMQLKRRNLYH